MCSYNYLDLFFDESVKISIKSLKSLFSQLPDLKAVYAVSLEDKIIYIGKADHLKNRWSNHHRSYDFDLILSLGITLDFRYLESDRIHPCTTKDFEANLIKTLKPILNYRVMPSRDFSHINILCEPNNSSDEIAVSAKRTEKEWQRIAISAISF